MDSTWIAKRYIKWELEYKNEELVINFKDDNFCLLDLKVTKPT